jgi:hypothetical protein
MTVESDLPSNESVSQQAFVTMVTTDSYVAGALVLAYSLRDSGTAYPIECIATKGVSEESIQIMRKIFNRVHIFDQIDSGLKDKLQLMGRPELGCSVSKIYLWKLEHLNKVVYLDADMLVLKNIDDLFERDELSASPDIGWPDCFNSGLFVCRPSENTFGKLYEHLQMHGSFDGNSKIFLQLISRRRSRPAEFFFFRVAEIRCLQADSIHLQYASKCHIQLRPSLYEVQRRCQGRSLYWGQQAMEGAGRQVCFPGQYPYEPS